MKNLTVSLLLLLAFGSITAQNFAPVGAKWHYTTEGFIDPQIGVFSFESVLDTVIAGQECRRIAGNTGCFEVSEYVFDRNDSVFFYHPGREEFCLLYDFGASVGDIWTVYHVFGDSSVIEVDSLGTLDVDGHALRMVHTSVIHSEWTVGFGGTFIERIGGIFPVIGFCDPVPGDLRCYEDTVLSFHQGPYECDEIVTSVQTVFNSQKQMFRITPNPFSDRILLTPNVTLIKDTSAMDYVLTSLTGIIVSTGRVENTEQTVILLNHLPSGTYLIRVSINKKQIQQLKIVKS